MRLAASIARTHHERRDGSGYPRGLSGRAIPIEGRLTAVADVFDALSNKRHYKNAYPYRRCFAILRDGRGTQFDPQILDAFFRCKEDIIRIHRENPDLEYCGAKTASFANN
jgi:putative two-component system response regulator